MKLFRPLIAASVALFVLVQAASVQGAVITTVADPLAGGQIINNLFTVGSAGTTANSNNWPALEIPSSLFDLNQATKYLNFGKLGTGVVVTPIFGSSVAKGID